MEADQGDFEVLKESGPHGFIRAKHLLKASWKVLVCTIVGEHFDEPKSQGELFILEHFHLLSVFFLHAKSLLCLDLFLLLFEVLEDPAHALYSVGGDLFL